MAATLAADVLRLGCCCVIRACAAVILGGEGSCLVPAAGLMLAHCQATCTGDEESSILNVATCLGSDCHITCCFMCHMHVRAPPHNKTGTKQCIRECCWYTRHNADHSWLQLCPLAYLPLPRGTPMARIHLSKTAFPAYTIRSAIMSS